MMIGSHTVPPNSRPVATGSHTYPAHPNGTHGTTGMSDATTRDKRMMTTRRHVDSNWNDLRQDEQQAVIDWAERNGIDTTITVGVEIVGEGQVEAEQCVVGWDGQYQFDGNQTLTRKVVYPVSEVPPDAFFDGNEWTDL